MFEQFRQNRSTRLIGIACKKKVITLARAPTHTHTYPDIYGKHYFYMGEIKKIFTKASGIFSKISTAPS